MEILITGFGPYDIGFDKAEVNPSWEGVRMINKEEIEARHGVTLIIEQLPVEYDEVDAKIKDLWTQHNFDVVIHVGLAKDAQCLRLEKQACKGSYFVGDCKGCCPVDFEHPLGEKETVLETALDLQAIVDEFNAEPPESELSVELSKDAGKFVCEYVYYSSLVHSESKRVLFVHVPSENYSHDEIARGLERLLGLILTHSS